MNLKEVYRAWIGDADEADLAADTHWESCYWNGVVPLFESYTTTNNPKYLEQFRQEDLIHNLGILNQFAEWKMRRLGYLCGWPLCRIVWNYRDYCPFTEQNPIPERQNEWVRHESH